VSAWLTNDVSALCSVIDVVCTNAHAYFNAATTPEQAGEFVAGQLKIVEDTCGKPGLVCESGWPVQGQTYGAAVAGMAEQKTAINSIIEVIGDKVVLFSYKDDPWKAASACGCETSFGCGHIFDS